MTLFSSRLRQWWQAFALPDALDPADQRRAELVRPMLRAALVVMLLVGPPWVYFSPPSEQLPSTVLAALAVLAILALLRLLKHGYSQAASLGLPAALLLLYGAGLFLLGGVRSPTTSGLLVTIVIAHVLLGERGAVLFAVLGGLVLLAVYVAELHGRVNVWPSGAGRAWVLLSGQLAFTARLLSLTLRPMRQGLADVRREHTRESERARELDALVRANHSLLSTLELDPLLHNILVAALEAIPAGEKGTVLLTDAERGELRIRALHGYDDPRIQYQAFAGTSGYSARTLRERRPWLIPDALSDPAIRYDGDIPEVRAIRSAIAAPLMLESEPVGVISLDSTRLAAFTERDLRLLEAFANTAAVAISNAYLHAEVRALANHDSLTGTANRRVLDATLPVEVARAQRYGHPVSLIFMDLDDFKHFNDSHGHQAGDERLRAVAGVAQRLIRHPDLLARYGGEEFALLLPHTGKAGALALAERIRAAAAAEAGAAGAAGGSVPGYTLSLGVATFPLDAATAPALLGAADAAELTAKRAGKNRLCSAPPLELSAGGTRE